MNQEKILESIHACVLPFGMLWRYNKEKSLLQVGMEREDTYTGASEVGWGGIAYVSEHSTDDEIVKKLFGLCLDYLEHEAREGFQYQERRVFGPHISLEALMEAAPKTTYRAARREAEKQRIKLAGMKLSPGDVLRLQNSAPPYFKAGDIVSILSVEVVEDHTSVKAVAWEEPFRDTYWYLEAKAYAGAYVQDLTSTHKGKEPEHVLSLMRATGDADAE